MKKTKLKTKKSVKKRFKITASGIWMRRPTGQNHFNAKVAGAARRKKKKLVRVAKADVKVLKKLLPYL